MKRSKRICFLAIILIVIVIGVMFYESTQPKTGKESYRLIGDADHIFNSQAIDTDNDGSVNFVVETDLWNIADCDGQLIMDIDIYPKGKYSLNVDIELKNIQQESSSNWVHGYPEIWVGSKPWNTLGPANDTLISLPLQISELNETNVCINISEYHIKKKDPNLPYNIALETWLTKNTTRGRDIEKGEKEIMLWLTYNKMHPAGQSVGIFDIPMVVNGMYTNITFELWKANTNWEYFAFMPEIPMENGVNVSFCWNALIEIARRYSDNFDWSHIYFMDAELGTEFGSPQYLNAQLSWEIKNFEITTSPVITQKLF